MRNIEKGKERIQTSEHIWIKRLLASELRKKNRGPSELRKKKVREGEPHVEK